MDTELSDALEMMGIVEPKQIVTEVSGFIPVFEVVLHHYKDYMTALVFGRMWQYCGMSDGVCRASLERIGKDIEVSAVTVMRHAEKLVNDGYLIDTTPGRRNAPHVYMDGRKVEMKSRFTAGMTINNATVINSNATVINSQLIKQDKTKINKDVSFSKQDHADMDNKMKYIIKNSNHSTWKGREQIRDNLLVLADWYNKTTGQVMTKRVQKSWYKALQDWQDEGLSPDNLQVAFDTQSKWRMVSDPNQLTKDAVAIKASGAVKADIIPVTYNAEGMPESW